MTNWRNYLRTSLLTLTIAGVPTFVAYAHVDMQDRIEKTRIEMESRRRGEEVLIDEIKERSGEHCCGMDIQADCYSERTREKMRTLQDQRQLDDYAVVTPFFVTTVSLPK